MLAFVYFCLLALAVQKIFLPMMPDLHGGHGLLINHSIVFYEKTVEIATRIHSHRWSEWSLLPSPNARNVSVLAAHYALFGPEPAVFIPLKVAIAGGKSLTGKSLVRMFFSKRLYKARVMEKKR